MAGNFGSSSKFGFVNAMKWKIIVLPHLVSAEARSKRINLAESSQFPILNLRAGKSETVFRVVCFIFRARLKWILLKVEHGITFATLLYVSNLMI